MSFVLGIVTIVVGGLLVIGSLGGIPEYRRTAGAARRKTLAAMIGAALIGLALILAGAALIGGVS